MTEDPLRALLADDDLLGNPADGAELLARAREREAALTRAATAVGIGVLVVALGAIPLLRSAPPADLTPRGADLGAQVSLDWLVEDQTLHRTTPESVAADQRVLFRATSSDAGFLCLDELTDQLRWERVFPSHGAAWEVTPGTHVPTLAGSIQAFRTDLTPGPRSYRLSLDSVDPDCANPVAQADRRIDWLP